MSFYQGSPQPTAYRVNPYGNGGYNVPSTPLQQNPDLPHYFHAR